MTAIEKNIKPRFTIVAALLSVFCLAAPVKARQTHEHTTLSKATDESQECDRQLVYQELENCKVHGKLQSSEELEPLHFQINSTGTHSADKPSNSFTRVSGSSAAALADASKASGFPQDRAIIPSNLQINSTGTHSTDKPSNSFTRVSGSSAAALADASKASGFPQDRAITPSNLSPNSALQTAQVPTGPIITPPQPPIPSTLPTPQPQAPPIITPSQPPVPQTPPTPQPLPPPEQLLPPTTPTPTTPEASPGKLPGSITVERFEFVGNTAFSSKQLAEVTKRFTGRSITFAELLEARSAVSQLYINNGYVTSGALIPPQTLDRGVVTIQIVEGGLEDIKVNGLRRLNPNYVRSRLGLATRKPLNVPRLLEALRLLQLDPLIANLSAELSAGSQSGSSLLTVSVKEASTFSTQIIANNSRSPSIGSFRRGIQFREANLLGLGDGISFTYGNTDGSNSYDLSYTLPVNARNGTISFSYGNTPSRVIEPPFDILDIEASSRYYDLTFRQPVSQTPTQEFALGLTVSRRESDTSLGVVGPFQLSEGADERGRTRVNSLRFFQEWTRRGSQEVIAARSQFSLGLGILDSTRNGSNPDSRFFSWRGQAQWVRLLAPDTLFLVRGDVQLADRPLLPIEQYGIGGQETLRGYRQDILLADNGANLTAELRLPILRIPQWKSLLQVAPFVDLGTVWNSGGKEAPNPNTLASIGLGLQLQVGNNLTVRLDYGIPLISVKSSARTWQENGLYFSILINPF